ncbi:MAG: FIST N-terminal domain-containing protein [Solirubrobacteraceae bacterium]
MRIGAGISSEHDALHGASEAARSAAAGLDGAAPDIAVVFASGAHLVTPEATLEAVHAELSPQSLVGCGAGGVLGCGRELESGTAVTVWAAALQGGSADVFHATVTEEQEDEPGVLEGLPEPGVDDTLVILPDPYSFPTDAVLAGLARDAPGVPVLGGLSSGRTLQGTGALFLDHEVREQGAVGFCLRGVDVLACVSQGAAPLGREMTITAAEGNVIQELAGRPALQTIEEVIGELELAERTLVAAGLLVGIVIDSGKPDYEQGDFLVRGVLGADPDTGAVAIGAHVEPGQILRLHARNAALAADDLGRELAMRAHVPSANEVAGALVFSCNGRGQAMFGACDHDAKLVGNVLGAPAAGFFAAGEIGPVGARSFLHAFTATVAVFADTS